MNDAPILGDRVQTDLISLLGSEIQDLREADEIERRCDFLQHDLKLTVYDTNTDTDTDTDTLSRHRNARSEKESEVRQS